MNNDNDMDINTINAINDDTPSRTESGTGTGQGGRTESMTNKSKVVLSPIDKYRLYGRFPYKMFSHIFLIISTTVQVMLINRIKTDYCRGQERVYYTNFISEAEKEDPDYARERYIYSVDLLKEHVTQSLTNYYSLRDSSFESIEYPTNNNANDQVSIEMKVDYIDQNNKVSLIPNDPIFHLTLDQLGPFSYPSPELKKYLQNINDFTLHYTIRSYVPLYYKECLECFGWSLTQYYDYNQRSHIVVRLNIDRFACIDKSLLSKFRISIMNYIWIHWLVIIFALTSFSLTWKSIYNMYKASVSIIKRRSDYYRNYSVNKWTFISLLGNMLQITGAILGCIDTENLSTATDILIGSGCMISYFSIGKYLNYDIEYSTIYATLQRSLPNSIRFLIGMMPLFIGFVCSGLCLFWRSNFFLTPSGASITLFSMINGDSIYDVTSDVTRVNFFLGQVYAYVFCILFIVVVMNVFISIIAEAYVSSKMRNQNHWIYNYLKVDPQFAQISGFDEYNDANAGSGVQLPEIEEMDSEEIKEELNKRMKRLKSNMRRCKVLAKDILRIENKITQEQLMSYLKTQLGSIEGKMKRLSDIWESGAIKH